MQSKAENIMFQPLISCSSVLSLPQWFLHFLCLPGSSQLISKINNSMSWSVGFFFSLWKKKKKLRKMSFQQHLIWKLLEILRILSFSHIGQCKWNSFTQLFSMRKTSISFETSFIQQFTSSSIFLSSRLWQGYSSFSLLWKFLNVICNVFYSAHL